MTNRILIIYADKKKTFYCKEMVETIAYCNEIVVVINSCITLLQWNSWSNTFSQQNNCGNKWNFRNKNLIAIYDIYCNGLQRLTFVAIKVYYNKMKVIAIKNFVAINLFLVVDIFYFKLLYE